MRRITLLLAFIGMITFQSCTVSDSAGTPSVVNNNTTTVNEVWEFTRSFTTANNFSNLITFPHSIYASDMVLMYRLSGVDNGADVWKLLPETYYMNDGTLDFRYDFDFTKYDASVFMDGFDLAGVSTTYRTNQVLRIVILPGYFGNKNTSTSAIDFKNYDAVMNAFKIDETKVFKIK